MTNLMVVKRNGEIVDFDSSKISNAIMKAVRAVSANISQDVADNITNDIVKEISERFTDFYPNIENIQDLVEKYLVKNALYEIAKEYILYRAKRQKEREEEKNKNVEKSLLGRLKVKKSDKKIALFNINKVKKNLARASVGYEKEVSIDLISKEVIKNVFDGISTNEIEKALILSSVSFIEKDPSYNHVSANLFLQKIYKEVIGKSTDENSLDTAYRESFIHGIKKGVEGEIMDKKLLEFDLEALAFSLKPERDKLFEYIGIQTLYERYFTKIDEKKIELPQAFWMRVAMGLAFGERDKDQKALEFYDTISSMRFVPSTPTLFHSGLRHPQLSSCYLTTVGDDLTNIFKCIGDNAQLSKWSGGLGNDWTNVRATGSWIKSTNVESQGVIPFLKIANDTTVAINRSGKRRGATCAYLETWHLDVEDFLDLRRNTGDERRRTHDMNIANWIPDLFMKRVLNDEPWTLFSPEEVPELHHIYGSKFEKKYLEYEEKARNGKIRKHKVVSATKLWRKMISMLFETGHPWVTFKDPCNIRSPQDHAGVVHSSNLCTEITLNTSVDETAVCNLGSINFEKHFVDGKLDIEILSKTVRTAIRMLDNVIDINFYPTIEAKNSNLRHRPIGLGIMGFQDALFKLRVPFDSPSALEFSDRSMEIVSYYAILASSELAKERGAYSSFKGSKWDRGILPVDTIDILEVERNMKIEVSRSESLDWTSIRAHIKRYGMRNSNIMAIAPTATISNISGCYPCIEPIYKNIYVKSNMSGEFTVVNQYLVQDLKKLNLWNQDMLDQIKYYDGNLQLIASIPEEIRNLYKEAFEIDPEWCVKLTAARGKWIDQSQSHNVFMKGTSGTKLSNVYMTAWKSGLKTTYYLRTLAASQIEKSTLDANKFGYTQRREYKAMDKVAEIQAIAQTAPSAQTIVPTIAMPMQEIIAMQPEVQNQNMHITQQMDNPSDIELSQSGAQTQVVKFCSLLDPDCEACQ